MKPSPDLQLKAINSLRILSAEAINAANSGHPGLPMGTAAIAFTIWTRHLRHQPANPQWFNRDRFILSGGHGSMLLYSLLHLTGYDLSMEEIQQFRQWGSQTPGHPEYGHTPGVEVTTGPLGQGFANGVGFAIAQAHLAARFNAQEFPLIDHYIYAIVTDGDLMEGVASEAASLAGHLSLGKLIYIYDDNRISIDGSTDLSFTEDRAKRFEAYGWHVSHIADGNDIEAIDAAIREAKLDPRPSLIIARTTIGYGLPTRAGTSKAHGEPPGKEELDGAKKEMRWLEAPFVIPQEVRDFYLQSSKQLAESEHAWQELRKAYAVTYPDQAQAFESILKGELPSGWQVGLPEFPANTKGMATRAASGKVLNALAKNIPGLIGGSADLAPSNKTWLDGFMAFQAEEPQGRNFHFGVREHAMGAIVNAMSLYPGVIAYGATFLVFSDYMRGALRLSALSKYPAIWVFTHDSIGVGEDGPTHQPVEQLLGLRSIPGMLTLRPADANETRIAWEVAVARRNGPTALALTRQNVPTLDRKRFAPADGLKQGAYILAEFGSTPAEIILMASGSEVALVLEAAEKLDAAGRAVRVVSFPSWELFEAQSKDYQESVLPPELNKRLVVEAGVSMGWDKYVGEHGIVIGIDHFGASAPAEILFEKYGFTVENILKQIAEHFS